MLHSTCSWLSPCRVVWSRCTAFPDLTHSVPQRSRHTARYSMALLSCENNSMVQNESDLLPVLSDAHSHPQLDPAHLQAVAHLRCHHLAAMSVSYDVDWDITLQLHKLAGNTLPKHLLLSSTNVQQIGAGHVWHLSFAGRSILPMLCLNFSLCHHAGPKVIPGFGIHPWWSHLHASPAGTHFCWGCLSSCTLFKARALHHYCIHAGLMTL